MNKPTKRLHFLDAIRAFAILMMLQGHFVHSLLGNIYRDKTNIVYSIWEYFRGMTAPTFFTITGFVFTFLILKQKSKGKNNPRVIKGVKRAIKLIFWGYLLRLSAFSIFEGTVNSSFFYVDVLQCIGISLLMLIGLYLMSYRYNIKLFQYLLLVLGVLIFLLQPLYDVLLLEFLPETFANYFTNKYGSIFTLFPWFGYVCFGGFLAVIFIRYGKQVRFYPFIISVMTFIGFLLIFYSSKGLMLLYDLSGVMVFKSVAYNNFLFIRLGNVTIIFTIFLILRNYLNAPIIAKIGGRTLSIYIIHFFVLYGSWFGLGLSRFFYRSLEPLEIIIGAAFFIVGVCALVLSYYKYEVEFKSKIDQSKLLIYNKLNSELPKNIISVSFIKSRLRRGYNALKYNRR
ncbi:heparan-alpha-glucosaminide N-acetyltransferase domain-containing protein [Aquimarina sp. 2201CG5-10]|uniref:heparan-alpha-glucosaminide N-acetyltransferase domain-containing protein n=1 Tax=Aquimarina callyspongiae TaxID=3098150 RepID=UPI002AB48943|nr:heparan-alpha-glucosaminide N-acetyltransferase domain-containing protein [Aquimarina sp. 2201CG5-10]MDY8136539.1 heparan-alpha-glucosaminide N-acetyltransferase domain-containing protein [Aquimarina sp. 2201CG5-10]